MYRLSNITARCLYTDPIGFLAQCQSNYKNAHGTRLRNIQQYHVYNAVSAFCSIQRYVAKKLLCQCTTISDESVVFLDLAITKGACPKSLWKN